MLEVRQQYAFWGILLYGASTIFVLYLAMELKQPEAWVWKGLFWVTQLFVCVNTVAKSFLAESRGRMLYFYSIAGARDFIIAKLLFNALLMVIMSFLSWVLFQLFLGNVLLYPGRFIGIACFGGLGLSLVFTFLSAIAARAQQNAAIMAILGFPLIIPQLLLLLKVSNIAFGDVIQGGLMQSLLLLAAFDLLIILLAVILFPFLWKD